MNCELIRYLLELRRGSTAPEFYDAEKMIRQHLAGCRSCEAIYQKENHFDQLLTRRIQQVVIPNQFQEKLLASLQSAEKPKKKTWKKIRRMVLAAAALMVVSGLGYVGFQKYWPKPITDTTWNHFWDDSFSWEVSPPDRDQVTTWFTAMGIKTELPEEVNYQHLVSHGLVLWDGKLVPQLVFANPSTNGGRPSIAKVLIVSSRQFRLESLYPLPSNQEGTRTKIDYLPESTDKSLYLVSHAGDKLDWLLTTNVSAALESKDGSSTPDQR